jgi:hypothetical protein
MSPTSFPLRATFIQIATDYNDADIVRSLQPMALASVFTAYSRLMTNRLPTMNK